MRKLKFMWTETILCSAIVETDETKQEFMERMTDLVQSDLVEMKCFVDKDFGEYRDFKVGEVPSR